MTGIYKIQSLIKPERIYVGSAKNFIVRKSGHFTALKQNKHCNTKLQHHYNKYGQEDLVFSPIYCCIKEELINAEQFFIDSYKPYFNICKVAGSNLGVKFTEEHKRKIRDANLGKIKSKETIEKITKNNWMRGRKHTLDARIKMRLNRKDKPCGMKGKYHSEETKQKMKIIHTGVRHTNEAKIKMRKPKPIGFSDKIRKSWEIRRLKKIL